MMSTEQDKGKIELAIFRDFIKLCPLSIDAQSVEKRMGESEPDIRCIVLGEGTVAFELVEVCDQTIAAMTSPRRAGESVAFWTSDPTDTIVRSKLHKNYKTHDPIELLCYTRGRVVTTDDEILQGLRNWANAIDCPFRTRTQRHAYRTWGRYQ